MKNGTKQRGLIGLVVMAVLAVVVIYGSTPLYQAIDNMGGGNEPLVLKDGTYTAEDAEPGDAGFNKGYKNVVTITVEDGKIATVLWDCVHEKGYTKIEESIAGDYIMTAGGKTWAEQSELLGAYLLEQQSLKELTLGEDGKTDAISGVSIDISGFTNMAQKALEEAAE